MSVFHIAERTEWEAAGAEYAPAAFTREGFVHCSFREQVLATALRYYQGRDDLVLLEIDESSLSSPLVVEPSPSTGEDFPHVYGRIDRAAVVGEHEFRPHADGTFSLPGSLGGDP